MHTYKSLILAIVLVSMTVVSNSSAANRGGFSESFDNINTLQQQGWIIENRSDFVTKVNWFQGIASDFESHSGPANSYIANTTATGVNTICSWLILPDIGFVDNLVFYARRMGLNNEVTRLLVMHSPTGGTQTGNCQSLPLRKGSGLDFGDFSPLLEINPGQTPDAFPADWQQQSVSVSSSGRLAFLFFVTDVGQAPFNSGLIAIDSVSTAGVSLTPPVMVPALDRMGLFLLLILIFIVYGWFHSKHNRGQKS